MNNFNILPLENNLSLAWLKAFEYLYESGDHELSPTLVSIEVNNENIQEDTEIRNLLDKYLKKFDENSCQTVASTIFPISLWNIDRDADFLFKRSNDCWPLIRPAESKRTRPSGFQRMINYNI